MALASHEQKEEIRAHVPLEELVREYNIPLQPSGRRLKGLCPFHQEKTPSFHVDPERQYFYCFGCQEKGDLFDFVQKIDNLEFPEALELLARRAGVVLERVSDRGAGLATRDALQFARDFYHQALLREPAAKAAREYLLERGIEPPTWERFSLGVSLSDGQTLLRAAASRGITAEILERAGLCRDRSEYGRSGHYDVFRGRLMFPIGDATGKTIGFGARTLGDDKAKYINTPKTPVFDKSQVLYAFHLSRRGVQREKCIVIVEGYTDAILAHQAGMDNVVASLGTAFTAENAARLGRLTERVLLIFDGDAAGQKASERSLDLLVGQNLDVRIYTVDGGMDPADAIRAAGGEAFRRRAEEESVGLFEFKWRCTMENLDVGGGASEASVTARALDEFLALLAKVPNVVARKLHIREFAERIGVSEKDLETRLKEVRRVPGRQAAGRQGLGTGQRQASEAPLQGREGRTTPSGVGSAVLAHSTAATAPAEGQARGRKGGRGADIQNSLPAGSIPQANRQNEGANGHENSLLNATNPADSDGEIEWVVLECLLALPHRVDEVLSAVPSGFFRGRATSQLVTIIERQLRDGGLKSQGIQPHHLVHEIEDPETRKALVGLLSRIENEDGSHARDYDEVWKFAQRDIGRHTNQRRIDALKSELVREPKGSEKHAACQRELFRILREQKRVRKV